jgi:hypothetical protein
MVEILRAGMKSFLPVDIGKKPTDYRAGIVVKAFNASRLTEPTP